MADGESSGVYWSSLKGLPEQASTTIRFFDRVGDGDTYLVFGKDAHLAIQVVYKTSAVLKTYGSGSKTVDCVQMNRVKFETWVKDLLLVKMYRVEVYVNTGKGSLQWTLSFRGSPGNLAQFEDLLFQNTEVTVNNGVVGVKIASVDKNKTVGVAHVNMNEWIVHLVEFLDDDALTNFEAVLVQLSPKEAVIPTTGAKPEDLVAMKRILERNGIMINERKASDFDTKDLHQDLSKLLKLKKGEPQNVASIPELDKTIASSSLCGVIKYLELLSGDTYLNQFKLVPFDYGLFCKMDAAACRALHLDQNILEQGSRNETTLLSVVDKCRTAQGKRLLAQFLKQPLVDINKIEERLDIVDILVNDVVLRQGLYEDHLRRIPDCQMLSRKLLRKRATLQDCFKGYLCIVKLPNLIKDLQQFEGEKRHVLDSYFVDPIQALQQDFDQFKQMVTETVDMEQAEKGEYILRKDIHEDYQRIREEMEEILDKMADETSKVARDLNLDSQKLKLEMNTQSGHFFRITLKDEKAIRNNSKYTIMHSTKGGVSFRNRALDNLSERYATKYRECQAEQRGFVEEIMKVAAGYSPCFEQLGNLMSLLDVLTNFAIISANSPSPFIRPRLYPKGTGIMKLEGLRHPCVEVQPNVNFIANDISFEKDTKRFYIVTGPNMGGKSTFLRSVGIATLLAQVGCYVPASAAEISIVDGILARVGAGDNLTKGVSTFMAEMIETSFILKTATADTLVLIDELGRGTSTYDGFGLCWAISEYLAKKVGCYCVLATHFHELTALAEEAKAVVNVHFSALADENGLAMLYKLENGPCDRSFGIHVTQVTDFPPNVIEAAKDMARKLEDFAQDEDKDDSEEAVMRRQQYRKAGVEAVNDFKSSLKASYENLQASIKDGTLTADEANQTFQEEASKLLDLISQKANNNPYIKHLLEQSKMTSIGA